MAGIVKRIEDDARRFQGRRDDFFVGAPREQIALEIGLLSERLDRTRKLHQEQTRELLRMECGIRTDLLALDSYLPRIPRIKGKERSVLEKRVEGLQLESLRRVREHGAGVAELQDRLFKLLRQHASLGGEE